MQFIFSSLHQILNDDSEAYAYFDAERPVDCGPITSIKVGAKFTDHDRDAGLQRDDLRRLPRADQHDARTDFFAGRLTPSDFLDGIAAPARSTQYWQINRGATADFLFDNLAGTGACRTRSRASASPRTRMPATSWASSTPAKLARQRRRPLRRDRPDVARQRSCTSSAQSRTRSATMTRSRSTATTTDVLPSLNLAYDLTDDIVSCVSRRRDVMARPDYTDIAPRTSLNPGALTGTQGNPEIDPYRGEPGRLSLEWYPQRERDPRGRRVLQGHRVVHHGQSRGSAAQRAG